MAAGSGGIDLLSVYNDEEEEDELEEVQVLQEAVEEQQRLAPDYVTLISPVAGRGPRATTPDHYFDTATPPSLGQTRSPPLDDVGDYTIQTSPVDNVTPSSLVARSPTPPPLFPSRSHSSPLSYVSPSSAPLLPQLSAGLPEPVDPQRVRMGMGSLAIVDYEHDETAMSPEPEDGEILSNGHPMLEADVKAPNGNAEDKTSSVTVPLVMPVTQLDPLQPSDLSEQPMIEHSLPMDVFESVPEVTKLETAVASMEGRKDDLLSSFLPPPPSAQCPKELQERFNRFFAYKRAGKSFNADLRNRKDYRNPDFLQHAVSYQDIDQIGTCFSKDVFDPHGYDKSDYVDEIENDMRREAERKKRQGDSVAGGRQPNAGVPRSNLNTQNSVGNLPAAAAAAAAAAAVVNVLPPGPTTDGTAKEIRPNKKTKWDKIDGDGKSSSLPGGHDNSSASSVHSALLSASNAGTGYTAFAQQKRREAEEKKSSERKFDKRS
ncbi:uncharacterized protein LOC122020499 isoform X2 [Zingiber officinale]|uniref:uncharacterized protein LOC122020499 isoform X2 n=1 Tax=Zingiber officinale TaxID=94328 RepID=UPI001C4CFB08|nr:uncharacterized protein LOC122020499 isoform X2 [Zingiber officinale]